MAQAGFDHEFEQAIRQRVRRGVQGRSAFNEETLLIDHLRRIQGIQSGIYAVHIQLSNLPQRRRESKYVRIAARAFEPLLTHYSATLFHLSNDDLVLVCRDVPVSELDRVIYKVRALFCGGASMVSYSGNQDLMVWYDLSVPEDFSALEATAAALVAAAQVRDGTAGPKPQVSKGRPLDSESLTRLGDKLRTTRVSDLVRQQMAVKITSLTEGGLFLCENYVSMDGLKRRLAPDIDLFSNQWLFQYLTEILDRRVLAVIAQRNFATTDVPISLNLNISTIFTPEFGAFNKRVGTHTDKIIIETQLINIFSDMGAYVHMRDVLKEQGYRILIDGLNPLTLQFLDPGLLKADFVKITWGPEFHGNIPDERMVEMRDVVAATGREKVILARVDSEAAVKWGLGLGINRFQGHYIDKLIAALAAKGPS